jgi:hypothetical protein
MNPLPTEWTGDAKPSATSILNHTAYEREVLHLGDGQKEEHIQDELRREAEAAGISPEVWKPDPISRPRLQSHPIRPSSATPSTSSSPQHRRSGSIASHKTCSTGATSFLSRPSVDHSYSSSTSPSKLLLNLSRPSYESRRSQTSTPTSTRQHSIVSFEVPSNGNGFKTEEREPSSRGRSALQRGLSKLSQLKRLHMGRSHYRSANH